MDEIDKDVELMHDVGIRACTAENGDFERGGGRAGIGRERA